MTFLIAKSVIVVLFLAMFLRRPKAIWGVGLLAVTSAVLLDTFLGTFGREEMIAELGFFFYVITGALFGASAIWMWGLLRPLMGVAAFVSDDGPSQNPGVTAGLNSADHQGAAEEEASPTAFDRQMLYEEIRYRFGRDDVLDLVFDLGINENDVMGLGQDMNQLIVNVMDETIRRGQSSALTLAVERILTPPPPEHLPRLEKINVDSPPTILRHYLLIHYDLAQLHQVAEELDIDWEQLAAGNKKEKVRSLLLYLYRRGRIGELIDYLHQSAGISAEN